MLLFVQLTLFMGILVLLTACALWPMAVGRTLERFFLNKTGPLSLAIARIVVFYMLFRAVVDVPLDLWLEIPAVFRDYPPGWGWTRALPLFESWATHGAKLVGTAAAGLACVGLATRITAPVAALSAVYILGLGHFFFKINHAGHPLIWCALIIACSPCNRALSLDALIKTARQGNPRLSMSAEPAVAYALPLRLCWLSFGVAYFFPGLFKVLNAGDLWVNGSALQTTLVKAMLSGDFTPPFPLHEHPALCAVAGIGTLVFELGFIFMLFSSKYWWAAPVTGGTFHLGVKLFMNISFLSMLKLYFIFIDFDRLAQRAFRHYPKILPWLGVLQSQAELARPSELSKLPRFAPIAVAGGVIVTANLFAGAAEINSWSFSVFPRFAARSTSIEPISTRDEITLQHSSGERVLLEQKRFRRYAAGAKWIYLVRHLAKAKGKRKEALGKGFVSLARNVGYKISAGDVLIVHRSRYKLRYGKPREFLDKAKIATFNL